MAKITRYNGNVQAPASTATGTERTVFGDTSQSDDLTTNVTADLLRGWGGVVGVGGVPPMQWFNAVAYVLGQFNAYLHQMGIAEYNATQEYHQDSVVTYGGVIYICNTNSTTGQTPGTDPEWDLLQAGDIEYDPTASGLTATDVKSAIDEIAGDYVRTDQSATITGDLTLQDTATTELIVDAPTGYDARVDLQENHKTSLVLSNDASASKGYVQKWNASGSASVSSIEFDESGNIDVVQGTFKINGSDVQTSATDPHAFNAYLASSETGIGSGTYILNSANFSSLTEDFDSGSDFTPSTGKFQPDEAGYYLVGVKVTGSNLSADLSGKIKKNGSTYIAHANPSYTGAGQSFIDVITNVYLNGSTDYIEFELSTTDASWDIQVADRRSYVFGHRL